MTTISETHILDINWDYILFPNILSRLSVKDWFNLRCVSKSFLNLMDQFLCQNNRIDLSLTKKYPERVFRILTDGCTSLKYLNLSGSKVITDKLLKTVLKENKGLKHIDLSNCHLLNSGVLQVLTIRNPDMQKLVLEDCHWVTRESIEYHAYYQGLNSTNKFKSPLLEANLTGCWELTDDIIKCFVLNFPRLKVLRLGKLYSLTDITAVAIAECLPDLEVLDIFGCWRITDSGLHLIGEYCKNMKQLYVNECRGVTEKSLTKFRQRNVIIDRKLDEIKKRLEQVRLGFRHDLPAI